MPRSPYDQRQPHPATPGEIARWLPNSWSEVGGNTEARNVLLDSIRADGAGPNILMTGPSRSGKTALASLYLATLGCTERGSSTDPCGRCHGCAGGVRRHGRCGIFSAAANSQFDIYKVDCTQPFSGSVQPVLNELKDGSTTRTVIYLDEFHRLAKHGSDEKLLIPLEYLNVQFIATAIESGLLDPAVLNRFLSVQTRVATDDEAKQFLDQRCRNWLLGFDPAADAERLATEIAHRSYGNCGRILLFLSSVAGRDRKINRSSIEGFSWHGPK